MRGRLALHLHVIRVWCGHDAAFLAKNGPYVRKGEGCLRELAEDLLLVKRTNRWVRN